MPDRLQLVMPWPPSVNGYWRAMRRGSGCCNILSKRGREYRGKADAAVRDAFEGPAITEDVEVVAVLHPPTRRKCDIDNYMKGLLDGMTHAGVWLDDSQVRKLTIERGEVRKGGEVHVEVVAA